MSLVIAFLVFLLIACVIGALVAWILSNIPGVPPWAPRVVWAVVGIVILLWVLGHLGAVGRVTI